MEDGKSAASRKSPPAAAGIARLPGQCPGTATPDLPCAGTAGAPTQEGCCHLPAAPPACQTPILSLAGGTRQKTPTNSSPSGQHHQVPWCTRTQAAARAATHPPFPPPPLTLRPASFVLCPGHCLCIFLRALTHPPCRLPPAPHPPRAVTGMGLRHPLGYPLALPAAQRWDPRQEQPDGEGLILPSPRSGSLQGSSAHPGPDP